MYFWSKTWSFCCKSYNNNNRSVIIIILKQLPATYTICVTFSSSAINWLSHHHPSKKTASNWPKQDAVKKYFLNIKIAIDFFSHKFCINVFCIYSYSSEKKNSDFKSEIQVYEVIACRPILITCFGTGNTRSKFLF